MLPILWQQFTESSVSLREGSLPLRISSTIPPAVTPLTNITSYIIVNNCTMI